MEKRSKFFVNYLNSFALGNPEMTEAWKALIREIEQDDFDVVAFSFPKRMTNELIVEIERLIKHKVS